MRLDVDLRFDAAPGRADGVGEARVLDLHTIAAAARSPRRLAQLLRDRRYDEVRVITDDLPLSALQAVAQVFLAIARTPVYRVDNQRMARPAFAAHALAQALIAIPAELAHTAVLAARARKYARRRYNLPATSVDPRRAVYLRIDPTMKWLGTQVGGAATHTSGVINGLIDNGIGVRALAAEPPSGAERATFVKVPVRRVLHLVRGLAYTGYTESVLSAAESSDGDFVYQRYQLGSYAGLELARRLAVPLVLEFNGSEIWVERHWGSGGLRLSGTLEELERRNLLDASVIVVVSAALRDYVVAQGADPNRVVVAPNGVDTDRLAPYRLQPPATWRERLGLPQQPTVGFIGTFGLWHGAALLPALIEQVPEARFLLIGDGGLLADVRDEVRARGLQSRTQLTGLLEREQALQMLAACDVCVSPHVPNPDGTPFFGSPTKLFEYMGLGKPIVASDLDQIGEVIVHERNGLLCPPGDVGAAAAAVRRLLDEPALGERLGSAALDDAIALYSWAAHVRRFLDVLRGDSAPSSDEAIASVTSR